MRLSCWGHRARVSSGIGGRDHSGATHARAHTQEGEHLDEAPEARHVVWPEEDDKLGARGEEDGEALEPAGGGVEARALRMGVAKECGVRTGLAAPRSGHVDRKRASHESSMLSQLRQALSSQMIGSRPSRALKRAAHSSSAACRCAASSFHVWLTKASHSPNPGDAWILGYFSDTSLALYSGYAYLHLLVSSIRILYADT
jgi:hypothetical protein